jgi:hypothetical protein
MSERGEPLWIAICRGLLCLVAISGVAIFAIFAVVLDPVSEMGMVPTQELRSFVISSKFKPSTPGTWNVILVGLLFPRRKRL